MSDGATREITGADVRSFILEHVRDQLAAVGLAPDEVADDFDLIATGTIDSMGLLELLAAMEERFGVTADLQELAVEDIGVVGPFCRHIVARADAGSGSRA